MFIIMKIIVVNFYFLLILGTILIYKGMDARLEVN